MNNFGLKLFTFFKTSISIIKKYFWDGVVGFVTFSIFWVVLYSFLPVPFTYLMVKRSITSEDFGLVSYEWKNFESVVSYPKVCAMAAEDQLLPFHYGIDFEAIQDALSGSSKKLRGASTITQQVAKNAFLGPSRTFVRKGFELYFTGLIECIWTKERILEVYLNIAEMGDMVFGVEAASQYFFKKPSIKINLNESALLISSLPNPIKYNIKKPGNYLQKRQQQIIRLHNSLDGHLYLRELYVSTPSSLYNFRKYRE